MRAQERDLPCCCALQLLLALSLLLAVPCPTAAGPTCYNEGMGVSHAPVILWLRGSVRGLSKCGCCMMPSAHAFLCLFTRAPPSLALLKPPIQALSLPTWTIKTTC